MNLAMITTAPSGCFAPVASWQGVLPNLEVKTVDIADMPVFNPAIFERYRNGYQVLTPEQAGESIVRKLEQSKHEIITAHDLEIYGEVMIRLAADIAAARANCNLAPLRGALKPAAMVEVMTRRGVKFDAFNFRRGADRVRNNDPALFRELAAIIASRCQGREVIKILSLDAVKGGFGSSGLVLLLRRIKNSDSAFRSQHWVIDLRLLRSEQRPWMADSATATYEPNFVVTTTFYGGCLTSRRPGAGGPRRFPSRR